MAEDAAKALQSRLKRPTLLKKMNKSHVSGGFWLGGLGSFGAKHLPGEDTTIALERGEAAGCWPVTWLGSKQGMSGGWRGFAIAMKLVPDDWVLFERKGDNVLKVFLFRAADYAPGATTPEDPFFEDAPSVDYKGRKAPAIQTGAKTPAKRPAGAEAAGAAPAAAKKAKASKAVAAAGTSGRQQQEKGAGEQDAAGPTGREGAPGGLRCEEEAADAGPSASPGQQQESAGKRRNPARAGRPDLARKPQPEPPSVSKKPRGPAPLTGKAAIAAAAVRKARAPRAPAGASAAERKPRKLRDSNAPKPEPKARNPTAPKRVKDIWHYQFKGEIKEMADVLKARYDELMGDAIRVDRATGDVLNAPDTGMFMRGYKQLCWLYNEDTQQYKPVHRVMVGAWPKKVKASKKDEEGEGEGGEVEEGGEEGGEDCEEGGRGKKGKGKAPAKAPTKGAKAAAPKVAKVPMKTAKAGKAKVASLAI